MPMTWVQREDDVYSPSCDLGNARIETDDTPFDHQ